MSDLSGKQLRDYQLLRRLGRGAMAEVYLAQQKSLDRRVAVKVLSAELARDPSCVSRFQHEARAAASLVHSGIVQIYEVGHVDGIHFIAQEYVAGRNLGEVIRAQGAIGPRMTLDVLRQVTASLMRAAEAGIVHRDIKPENILLTHAGEVKVADFGLARVQGNEGARLTQVGMTLGTPLYMSPEQLEGRALDSRSDIYSLGVTAYHMLAGSPPFAADTPLALAVLHLNESPEPLTDRRPDVPPALAAVVHRMMAKKPADRFADPIALLAELHTIAQDGATEGWAEGPDQWSISQAIAAADDRADANRRLSDVMKTTSIATARRPLPPVWALGLAAACLMLGAAAALWLRPPSVLSEAEIGPPARSSAWAQLYHANLVDTEAAWKAVARHFPNADRYYHNLARQGLTRHYLFSSGQYEQAIRPLRELAELGDAEPAMHAFGTAGLVVAYARLGDEDRARNVNDRLTVERRVLLRQRDPEMADALKTTLEEINR